MAKCRLLSVILLIHGIAALKYMLLKERKCVYGNSVLRPQVKFLKPSGLFFIVRGETNCWEKMELFANVERPVYDHTVCDLCEVLKRIYLTANRLYWYTYKDDLDLHAQQWLYFRLEATHKQGNVTVLHGKAPMKTKLNSIW